MAISWSNTRIKLDNGTTLTIPRQVLQAKRSHAVHQYKLHCAEVDFRTLSDRKLLDLLDGINTRSQR